LTVVQDLADEVWIGDVCNHAPLPAAERAAGDLDFEDVLYALRPD